ncbi:LysR family transcriptional regulator [Acidisphaera sp. S103]|uniref:LysR family transcriptional regulator n=1 Tax=Acidisphaera sp. S103 TaxID=1747223 RepID=UPI00131E2EF1|nr:LysR family transcriptional regulator [Acidisphaera sp. S103]
MRVSEWSDLKVVLAVARAKTLRASAQSLHVDQSTVSRRLAALEEALGVRLFERLEGAITPTQAGEIVIEAAEQIETQILSIQERVGNQDAATAGTVRVTTVTTIANHVLVPAMPMLRSQHPALCLELIFDNSNLSITRREADLAVRFPRPSKDDEMLCKRIGEIEYSAFHVAGTNVEELPWLTYEDSHTDVPQARWIASNNRATNPIPLLVNDGEAILYAVRNGLGKSLLPTFMQSRFKELQIVPNYRTVLTREVWLIVHPRIRQLARVQAVMSWITSALSLVSRTKRSVAEKP